jgi:hypothetical protein
LSCSSFMPNLKESQEVCVAAGAFLDKLSSPHASFRNLENLAPSKEGARFS